MEDYEVGYGKPPKAHQFPANTSGNQKGRPKRGTDVVGEVVQNILDTPMRYRENGRTKTASRREVRMKLLIERAMKGDVGAALLILKKRRQAIRQEGTTPRRIVISDWLPDSPGQTAEEKRAAMAVPAERLVPRRPGEAQTGKKRASPGSSNEQES